MAKKPIKKPTPKAKRFSVKWQMMSIKDIKPNSNNPRIIKDANFKKLVKSLKEFPEMLKIRPIVIDEKNMVIGGNQRLKAAIELKLKQVPVVNTSNLTPAQKKEFIIKDNPTPGSSGDWDLESLSDWDSVKLEDWGLELNKKNKVEFFVDDKNTKSFFLNIEFDKESDCNKLYNELSERGFDVKIIS